MSGYDRSVVVDLWERENDRDILGSIRDRATVTMIGRLVLTMVWMMVWKMCFMSAGITLLVHSSSDGESEFVTG